HRTPAALSRGAARGDRAALADLVGPGDRRRQHRDDAGDRHVQGEVVAGRRPALLRGCRATYNGAGRPAHRRRPVRKETRMADLSVTVDGLRLPNPFIIGSGPPGTNANVIGKAFDEGWGAVICKTVSLDASKVVNVQPRYGRLRAAGSDEIIGWENIELISDRPFGTWLDEFKQIK